MLEKSAFFEAVELLKPECFYVDAHIRIFGAMIGLAQKNMPIDILTVVEELRSRDELDVVGGPYFVTKLTNSVASSANIETHCQILVQKFIQRELIRISGEIISNAYEDSTDAFDLLDYAESKLFEVSSGHEKKAIESTGTLATSTINRYEHQRNNKQDLQGVTTGYVTVDNITGGLKQPDLIIIAARPSVGKTAFALNLAKNAAMHPVTPVPVGIFSMEMSNDQLMDRFASMISEVKMDQVTRGRMDDYQFSMVTNGVVKLSDSPIYMDDTAGLSLFEVRAKARRMVSKYKVGLIIIDYLQLMVGKDDKGNREQEISNISRGLKGMAKDLKIPIIALSQLNRAVEGRKDGVPMLSDLRESGAIEQDADQVWFIYRPDYQQEAGQINPIYQNDAFLKIAKHRNGALETLAFKTDLSIQTWYDLPAWEERTGEKSPGRWTPVAINKPTSEPVKNFYDTDDNDKEDLPF